MGNWFCIPINNPPTPHKNTIIPIVTSDISECMPSIKTEEQTISEFSIYAPPTPKNASNKMKIKTKKNYRDDFSFNG
jgi:hypothetical protein